MSGCLVGSTGLLFRGWLRGPLLPSSPRSYLPSGDLQMLPPPPHLHILVWPPGGEPLPPWGKARLHHLWQVKGHTQVLCAQQVGPRWAVAVSTQTFSVLPL